MLNFLTKMAFVLLRLTYDYIITYYTLIIVPFFTADNPGSYIYTQGEGYLV